MKDLGILLESGTNEMELLTVVVNAQPFGMNVAKVQSIQQYDPGAITALPEAEKGVLGMLLYRDTTIPVLDLARILDIDLDRGEVEPLREIIVVTEFNNSVTGFRVQGVKRIHRLSWKEFVPLDQLFEDNACFTGSVNIENSQVLVLDLEYILSSFFPDQVIEEVDEEMIQKGNTISRDQLEIVFAEDSPTIQKGVFSALKKAGFEKITPFLDGEKALNYIRSHYKTGKKQELNHVVLITDIEMPRMDGLTLCRVIKQDPELHPIFVVIFSSLINSQMIAKCEQVKSDDYVTKPETNRLITILDQRCG
ncbi:chemotaxis protein [Desulfospira joergensenii]|uniref:chemotaxis protein n=1 Tax=Desulfospira joergensenii TaxID=53329 RepID=UPI0003B523ED|nr:chemotaxis protein [Desulfospira joergensenii]